MQRNVMLKLGTIALLIVMLMIPLSLIDGIISERQSMRLHVLEDIAQSASHSQRITGPLLVVPYRKTVREWRTDALTQQRREETREVAGRLYFLPEQFKLSTDMHTELRSRGIHQARLYHSVNHFQGQFSIPARFGITDHLTDYRFDAPFVALGISDIRGIGNGLKLVWEGETLSFKPGSQVEFLGDGAHVQLAKMSAESLQHIEFDYTLHLQGTGSWSVIPMGRDSAVHLNADWPHPSFYGNFLPVERQISDAGFSARWQTSFFSTNLEQALQSCVAKNQCDDFHKRHFGVSLINPVDQYVQSDRAIKYALLFIVLTFSVFFLFEVLKRLSIHPVQYGLVGVALAVFYLLLLSLSEHIGFGLAYLVSAAGCAGLIGSYVSAVLGNLRRAAMFSLGLLLLYGFHFLLLRAEDYALLMGSLLVFVLLAVIMTTTRHVDWYTLRKPVDESMKQPVADTHLGAQ